MEEKIENENRWKKLPLRTRIILGTIIPLIIVAGIIAYFVISNKPSDPGGYSLIEADIKSTLYVPSSYKVESVYYKKDITSSFKINDPVDYQYKVTYKAKTRAGIEIYGCVYYGYNSETQEIYSYGDNSSNYNSAGGDEIQYI